MTAWVLRRHRHAREMRRRIARISKSPRRLPCSFCNPISEDEAKDLSALYEEIAKMLTGLIAHLTREDRKNRP